MKAKRKYRKHVKGVDDETVLFGGLQDLVYVGSASEEVRKPLLELIEDVQTFEVDWGLLLELLSRSKVQWLGRCLEVLDA